MPGRASKLAVETHKANEKIRAGKWDQIAPSDAVASVLVDDIRDSEWGPAIANVLSVGDALIVGRTRDGGAIALTILSGQDRRKMYAADAEELSALLLKIARA